MQISVQDLPVRKFGVSTIVNYNYYYEFVQSFCKIYIKLICSHNFFSKFTV